MKHEYPKFIYHRSLEPKIVLSKDEHLSAGKDWFEHPDEAKEIKEPKKTKAKINVNR